MDVFAADIEFPDPVFPERQPQDLRISPGSAAEDAAMLLPNINDDFTGNAPDIGAYEIGKPLPHYGPRPVLLFSDGFESGDTTRWSFSTP